MIFMKTVLAYIHKSRVLLLVWGALLLAGSATLLGAAPIKRCLFQIPLSGSKKVVTDKESHLIEKNIRKITAKVDELREQLGIHSDTIAWQVPNAVLHACNIPLPTYTNVKGFQVNSSDRIMHITLRDMGKVVEEYRDEVIENLEHVCEENSFDCSAQAISVTIDNVAIFHDTSPLKNDDRVVVALNITSQENIFDTLASILDHEIVQHRGLPRKHAEFIPHITIAIFNDLSHSQANKLVKKLKAAKRQLVLDTRPVRIRRFALSYGSYSYGPWDIRSFTQVV